MFKIKVKVMKVKFMWELDFAFYSDVGGRANNEDSYLAKRIGDAYVFIVADGLGGHDDGEVASRSVVDAVKECLLNGVSISDSIEYANSVITQLQNSTDSKMKTTIASVYMDEENTVIAHIGDTRIYAFKDGELVFQSTDHSASQLAVMVGEIELGEIRNHPDRNVLTRAIGSSEEVKPDVTCVATSSFDALLLCSDGFWEYVLESDMISALNDSKSADKWLYKMRTIQLERAPKNCDNNTAIAVMV